MLRGFFLEEEEDMFGGLSGFRISCLSVCCCLDWIIGLSVVGELV